MQPTRPYRHLLTAIFAALWSSSSLAAVGQITVDGELIPVSLFPAYEQRYVLSNEVCPPTSDAKVRDGVIHLWLSRDDGRANDRELEDYTIEAMDELQEGIDALPDGAQKADLQIRLLQREASSYSGHRRAIVSEEAAVALYEQRVADRDPALIDVPVVRFLKVQFDKRTDEMQAFVDALEGGASWETLMQPLEGFTRNNDLNDQWHTIADMDDYTNTTVQRLVGDGRQLKAGDVIGPIAMYAYGQIFRIEEARVLPVVQLDQPLNGEDAYGLEYATNMLRQRHFAKVRAELRAGREILEDGEAVDFSEQYPVCEDG